MTRMTDSGRARLKLRGMKRARARWVEYERFREEFRLAMRAVCGPWDVAGGQ